MTTVICGRDACELPDGEKLQGLLESAGFLFGRSLCADRALVNRQPALSGGEVPADATVEVQP